MCHRALSKSYKRFSRRESGLLSVHMIRIVRGICFSNTTFCIHIHQTITSIPPSSGYGEETEGSVTLERPYSTCRNSNSVLRDLSTNHRKQTCMVARSKIDVKCPYCKIIAEPLCWWVLLGLLQPRFLHSCKVLNPFLLPVPVPTRKSHLQMVRSFKVWVEMFARVRFRDKLLNPLPWLPRSQVECFFHLTFWIWELNTRQEVEHLLDFLFPGNCPLF